MSTEQTPPLIRPADIERFMAKVSPEPNTGCWLWLGAMSSTWYGSIWIDGRQVGAHRVALMLRLGTPIPDGMDACHLCDNPSCVNPDHVFAGTARDNMADCKRKGRTARVCGESNGRSTLTTVQVQEIRRRGASGEGRRALARAFGVSHVTVIRILSGARRAAS